MEDQKFTKDQAALKGMLSSPEAQALLGRLKQADTGALQAAARKAMEGDTQALSGIVQGLSRDPEAARAMEALNRKLGK